MLCYRSWLGGFGMCRLPLRLHALGWLSAYMGDRAGRFCFRHPDHLLGQLGYRLGDPRSLGRFGRLGRLGGLLRRSWLNLRAGRLLGTGRLYAGSPYMGGKADAGFLRRPPGRRRRLRRRPGLGSRLWWSGLGGRFRRRRRRRPRSLGWWRMGGLWLWRRCEPGRGRRRPCHLPGRLNHCLGRLWGRSRFRRRRLRRFCLNRFNSRLSRGSLLKQTGRRLGRSLARRRLRSRLLTLRAYMGSQAHTNLLGRRTALRNGSGLCGGRLRLWRRWSGRLGRSLHRLLGRLRLWRRRPKRRRSRFMRLHWFRRRWCGLRLWRRSRHRRRTPPNELSGDLLNLLRWRRMRWWGLPSRSGLAYTWREAYNAAPRPYDEFRPRGLRPYHLPCRLNHSLRGRRSGWRPRAGDFPRDLPNWRIERPDDWCGGPRRWPWRRRRRWALNDGCAGRRTVLGLRRTARRTRAVLGGCTVVPPYPRSPKRHVAT